MRSSLKLKLILSFLAVALTTILVVSVVIRLTSGYTLMNLVVEQQTALLSQSAQSYYTANGTLDGFFDDYIQNNPAGYDSNQPDNPEKPQKSRDIRGLHGLVDTEYRALIPTLGFDVGTTVPVTMIKQTIPVEVNGETIAWILPDNSYEFKLSTEEELFLHRTTLAVGLAALAGVILAVAMGFFLAGVLLKPIRRLSQASQALARGDLQQQVPVSSQDELGQLTAAFNQMSNDLAQADQQRKRLTADITHDLSTPLQVISGYVEMMEEGEVTMTPQRIEIIKTEINHIRRLVGDLSILTQVEANRLDIELHPVHPTALLEHIFQAYQPIAARQGVTITVDAPSSLPEILIDEGRMEQVLKNLVENALRYTPKGGQIHLSACEKDKVNIKVSDNGAGVDPEDLPYLFDRFYRADKARGINSGKMGLGLAICKALVNAQGGTITAESEGKGKGITVIITFEPE